jgi:membrane fusion protein, multidrug efflux system
MSPRHRGALPALLLVALVGCGGSTAQEDPKPTTSERPAGTPVRVATVELGTMERTVSAPGRTVALVQQKVRAPFAGTLTALSPVVGDTVKQGEMIGAVVARDSEAAVIGAEEMLRDAKAAPARADAERALALARRNRIVSPLRSTVTGVVTDRAAAAGDRVAEDQELLTVAALDSLVFVADLAQSDLVEVHPGQAVQVELTGRSKPLRGVVHGLLANADAANSTAPLRVDLMPPPKSLVVGLFGTVRITVARRTRTLVVPKSAVLTDDVSGVRRLAEVLGGRAHWIEVSTGLSDAARIEITNPALAPGVEVIVEGQVGLPEGAPVTTQP